MKRLTLLKRVLFWLESSVSAVVVLSGAAILVWSIVRALLSEDPAASARELVEVAVYFVDPAIRIVSSEPLIVVMTLFWLCGYILTMKFFAQTALEKRLSNYLIPLALASLPICAIAVFVNAIAGLASQGAGP